MDVGAKTQRERDYIDAIAAMYVDYDKVDHRTRVQRYLAAEEQVATRYPNDDDAQIAYAITLNVAASPADKTYANQLKGAALLEPIFKRQPDHPGVAHYLIHLYDYPPLAMLLDRGMAKETLAAYEAVLKKEPNRLAAYVGAAKSATAFGDQGKAQEYAAQIVRLTTSADVSRPELIEIRETTGTKP